MTDGRDVVIVSVHGTGDSQPDPETPKWWEDGSRFATAVKSRLSGHGIEARFLSVQWGGANSHTERLEGARKFADEIHANCKDCDVHVVAHSHGGNVVLDAFSRMKGIEETIKTVLLVGTPHLRRISSPLEWVFLVVAFVAMASLVLLAFNAPLYFGQCVDGEPSGLFGWLMAETTPCDSSPPSWGPYAWLLDWRFLLPVSGAFVFLGYVLAFFRNAFFVFGGGVTVLAFFVLVTVTSGYSIFLIQIVLEILFLLTAGLWTGQLFSRALKPARERHLMRKSQTAFAGKVKQIYHDNDEIIDLLRHVRRNRIQIASREQAGRLVESVLLFAGIAAVVSTLLLILYEPILNVTLGSSAVGPPPELDADAVPTGGSPELAPPGFEQAELRRILIVLCGTPILLGFAYFTVIMAGRIAKVWISGTGAEAVNKTLSGIVSNAVLGDDSSGRVVFSEERMSRMPRIEMPESCAHEMLHRAAATRETTFATLLANGLLQPSGWMSEPETLLRYITYREVVHCGYFETDFLVEAMTEQVISHRE